VSKRPEAGAKPQSGKRSLVGYLRDRRIGVKLGFIMFVPTLATVIVGANGLVSQISTASTADRARVLATLSGDAGALVHDLQNERANAAMLLGSTSTADTAAAGKEFQKAVVATDGAKDDYNRQSSSQANLPDNFKSLLSSIQSQLGALPKLRQDISDTTTAMPLSLAVQQYDVLITGLLGIRDSSVQLAGDSNLSYEMRAAAAISSAKEYLAQERVIVLQSILNHSMPPEQRQRFIATQTGITQALNAFAVVATTDQQDELHRTVSGSELRPSQHFENSILAQTGDAMPSDLTATDWNSAMTQRAELMRKVEVFIDQQTIADAQTLRDNVQRQIIIDVGLLFGMVLIAMLIAWFVARSMNRSLRELKHGALTVAQFGLPQAVQRLRDPNVATQQTPHEVALQIAEPLPVRSRDEFGEVTEAFNAVHLEAVRTAAEQAALRASVATMFVNLARRSQILVDRLIGHLDRLERGEEDPDRLAELFQLDHLATRMRRNDENLLVLAGADSTRVQREPAALIDVLRAAQSEVEHYTRIEFGMIDRDIEVAAHAVNDLVHLVAELFDNATAFSPPDAAVIVEARRVGDRAVLYVEDHGIGIGMDQLADLNERLATPPMVDVAVSRMMGLVVVARLAARHGIKVELRPANDRGTVADVLLPTTVLVPRALSGRNTAPSALPQEPIRPQSRSPFSPPLALEGGSRSPGGFEPARPLAGAASGGFGGARDTGPNNGYGTSMNSGYGEPGGYRQPANGGADAGFSGPGLGGFAAAAENFGDHDLFGNKKSLPSWSDLTGAGDGPEPATNKAGGLALPLPQRPSNDQWDSRPNPYSDLTSGWDRPSEQRPHIPRQRPTAAPLDEAALMDDFAEAELVDDPYAEPIDDDLADVVDAHVDERPPPASAPPAWPPVQASGLPSNGGGTGRTLDMTNEIPAVRDLDLAGALRNDRAGQPVAEAGSVSQSVHRPTSEPSAVLPFADETMELPIFRELESAWFQTVPETAPLPERTDDVGAAGARIPAGGAPRASGTTMGGTSMATTTTDGGRRPESNWTSPADDGWRAAASAAHTSETEVTDGGLPKRVPMAQLVPGGVEKATTATNRRSPESVRGLLSAYHRGVQRGRQQSGEDSNASSESTTTGHPSPGGKEQ